MLGLGRSRAVLAGMLGLTAAAVIALPASAAAAKKPDLVPSDGRIRGPTVVDFGERFAHKVEFATKNEGNKRAGPTVTKLYLRHGEQGLALASRAVPGLDPDFKHHPPEENVNRRNRLPVGEYDVVLCVDAKDTERESNEQNNCTPVKKDFSRFYSIYSQYVGTATGVGQGHPFDPAVTESWNAQSIGFIERPQLSNAAQGLFTYTPDAEGTVLYTLGGTTDTNCVFTGSGVLSLAAYPNSFITIDWGHENYGGTATPFGQYPTQSSCEPDNPGQGPFNGFALQTGLLLGQQQSLPFGSRSLQGSYSDTLGFGTTNYTWNLAGG